MQATRRRALATWLGLGLVGSLFAWWTRRTAPPSPPVDVRTTLTTWIDVLLPADGQTPGAVETGVVGRIIDASRDDPSLAKLLSAGLSWVQAQAIERGAPDFLALDAAGREAIVAAAAAAAPGSTARVFFQSTLDDALYHHYADPRSWVGLGYDGPPQPRGFPDHDRPWA